MLEGRSGVTGWTTVKAVRTRDSDNAHWNTSGTPAWEVFNAANIADYGIAASEVGATGQYAVSDPAPMVEGKYVMVRAAGASLTVADLLTNIFWEGQAGASASSAPSAAAISTQVAADLAAAHGGGNWETAVGFASATVAPSWYTAPSAGTDWSAGERSQIRQALGVAGTVAATTGTGNVDLIKLHTDMLGTGVATVYSPVSPGGTVMLTRGDDYAAATGGHPPLLFTAPTADAWGDLTGSTVALHFGGVSYPGTILTATGMQQIQFELTDTQTSAIPIGRYRYGITFTRGTDTSTPVKGLVVVD